MPSQPTLVHVTKISRSNMPHQRTSRTWQNLADTHAMSTNIIAHEKILAGRDVMSANIIVRDHGATSARFAASSVSFTVSPLKAARYHGAPQDVSRQTLEDQRKKNPMPKLPKYRKNWKTIFSSSDLVRELPKSPKKGSDNFQTLPKVQKKHPRDQEKLISTLENRKPSPKSRDWYICDKEPVQYPSRHSLSYLSQLWLHLPVKVQETRDYNSWPGGGKSPIQGKA